MFTNKVCLYYKSPITNHTKHLTSMVMRQSNFNRKLYRPINTNYLSPSHTTNLKCITWTTKISNV